MMSMTHSPTFDKDKEDLENSEIIIENNFMYIYVACLTHTMIRCLCKYQLILARINNHYPLIHVNAGPLINPLPPSNLQNECHGIYWSKYGMY